MRRLIWLLAAGWLVGEGAVPQPPGSKVLFADDFETGDARHWLTEHLPGEGPAWQVERQENNFVYSNQRGGTATLEGSWWYDHRIKLRFRVVRGYLVLNFRARIVIYAGIENGGVYKSTDAGGRWSQASFGMDPQAVIRDIVIDPTNPEAIYAADLRTGVYRSTDGGKSWFQINRGLRTRAVNALAVSDDGSVVYAATEGEGIFRLDLKPQAEAVVAPVSAASFVKDAPLAPESIASLFGQGLAGATQQAASTPLPTVLSDASVSITDSSGMDRWAPLFFASPGQINCQIPAGTAPGTATVRVFRQNRVVARGQVQIEAVAPALFAANADGKGAPAAVPLRVAADGTQTQLPVFQCGAAAGSCAPAPIDLGAESDQVILLLFGTGIRGGKSVSVRIGGFEAPVLGAAAQGQFVGLDQVNIRLPRDLRGRGEVELTLAVEGRAANTVKLRFQ